MDERNEIIEVDEMDIKTPTEAEKDELTKAVEETMEKIRTQSMLLGAQAMCTVVLQKITVAMNQPGKRSMNDYKRLVKDIEDFCRTGLSRTVNPDGTTSPVNDNTKLMEE